uniref:Tyrosine specific protein phosphatases domain-containing protein n=1 Tax=Globisporangium ultimum (strain ATCC 200006 / CBS 805.95 / DAOM BR144) TaxID=431595 RepID=K3W5B8_GLOUD
MSTLVYPSREKLWTVAQAGPSTFYKLPRFFRWVVPFQLAAMSTPRNGDDIRHLALPVGIHHIVTLTEEEPLPREWFAGLLSHVMRHTFLPVENYKVPTLAQIDLFMRICTEAVESGPVLVHCGGGKGRAGVMLACYLVAFGWRAPPSDLSLWMQPAMSADQAIESLRVLRPGSIETEIQEAIVRSYSSLLWKRQAVLPIPVDEPMISRPIVSGEPIDKTDLLVLCGLPGSGKTTFRRLVVKRTVAASTHMSPSDRPVRGGPAPWTGLSGDEHGRQGCERSIGLKGIQRAILDHVNGKAEDRKYFIKLASTWSTHATAVWFDFESELCIYRAQRRSDHPSLPPGRRVENAVQQHAREFEPPTLSEGFRGIVRVTSIEAAQELALLLAPPLPLLKFPRTPHAINLGAATDDDLIMADPFPQVTRRAVPSPSGAASTPCATSTTRIVITEKVDGANLGISLSPDGYKFVVQNRSHYIASSSHPQFRKLDTFLEAHRDTLMAILKQDKLFPDRFILYGEWLAAKHSIPYSNLNDWFYAFDLFDREEHRFWDRASFVALVTAANNQTASLSVADPILIVPELWSGTELPARDTLIQMAQQTRSHFYDGVIEGLYIKWEAPDHVQQRGKVVRADFICGNEHWTKNIIQFNTVVPQEPRYGS